MPLLFLYGTLKRGGVNHRHLAGQRFAGAARTEPAFRLYLLEGYPGMTAARSGGVSVEGELWEVDGPCLARLDELEGLDEKLYERTPVKLLAPNEGLAAETYVYLRSVEGRKELGARFE